MIFFCGSVYFGQQFKKNDVYFFTITISRGTPAEKPFSTLYKCYSTYSLYFMWKKVIIIIIIIIIKNGNEKKTIHILALGLKY
jgi:hypothetical protein